jgi:autotransporter-associated beta strand protein
MSRRTAVRRWGGPITFRATIHRCALPAAAVALAIFNSKALQAATATWDGDSAVGAPGDGTTWTDADNWTSNGIVDSLPGNTNAIADDLFFGGGTVGTIDFSAKELANSVDFTAGFTLSPASDTDSLSIITGTVSVASGISAAINAEISGNHPLIVAGPGTLTIDGANTYAGATTVSGGTLVVGSSSNLSSAGVTVDAAGTLDLDNNASFGATVTNDGNFTVGLGAAATFAGSGATFDQSGGSLTIDGTLGTGGSGFSYDGGSITGTVSIGSNAVAPTLSLGSGAGNSGTFILTGKGATLTGTSPVMIQSNQVVTLQPTASSGSATVSDDMVNAGALTIIGSNTSTATLAMDINTVTNTGTLSTSVTGSPSTTSDFIVGSIDNTTGTVNINASTEINGAITNSGTFNIASGQTLTVDSTYTFTQSGGTATIDGTLNLPYNHFNYTGGTIDGTGTVVLGSPGHFVELEFGSGAGHGGTFVFPGDGAALTGGSTTVIPSGVTVTVQPTSGSSNLSDANPISNAGNLNLIGSATSTATISPSATLTNTGTLTTSATGSPSTVSTFIVGTLSNTTGTVNVNASLQVDGVVANTGIINIAAGQSFGMEKASEEFKQTGGEINVMGGGLLDVSNSTLFLHGGVISLSAGTPGNAGELKLGFTEYSANSTTGTIASGTVGVGQAPGYVDLGGYTIGLAVGRGTQPEQVIISAPITDGGIIKSGSGIAEFSGDNTYALGTEVSNGTLLVGAGGGCQPPGP